MISNLQRVCKLEGAECKIRVNTANPAPIKTRMMRSLDEGFAPGAAAHAKERVAAPRLLQRYGSLEEVANLMWFLVSDESRYYDSDVCIADDGISAR